MDYFWIRNELHLRATDFFITTGLTHVTGSLIMHEDYVEFLRYIPSEMLYSSCADCIKTTTQVTELCDSVNDWARLITCTRPTLAGGPSALLMGKFYFHAY
jgi:hypothetical protein